MHHATLLSLATHISASLPPPAQNGYKVDLGARKVASSVGANGSGGYAPVGGDEWGSSNGGGYGGAYQQAPAAGGDEWGGGGVGNGSAGGNGRAGGQQAAGNGEWSGWDDASPAHKASAAPGGRKAAAAPAEDDEWGKW